MKKKMLLLCGASLLVVANFAFADSYGNAMATPGMTDTKIPSGSHVDTQTGNPVGAIGNSNSKGPANDLPSETGSNSGSMNGSNSAVGGVHNDMPSSGTTINKGTGGVLGGGAGSVGGSIGGGSH